MGSKGDIYSLFLGYNPRKLSSALCSLRTAACIPEFLYNFVLIPIHFHSSEAFVSSSDFYSIIFFVQWFSKCLYTPFHFSSNFNIVRCSRSIEVAILAELSYAFYFKRSSYIFCASISSSLFLVHNLPLEVAMLVENLLYINDCFWKQLRSSGSSGLIISRVLWLLAPAFHKPWTFSDPCR